MSGNKEEINDMIDDCMNRQEKLSEWEGNFIDSIYDQVGDGKSLTKKQVETLNNIWERVTN